MKIETIAQLETLLQMVSSHKLDLLEVDGIRIVKSKHDFAQSKPKELQPDELEELLYMSATQGS